jgi:hypothetical protein
MMTRVTNITDEVAFLDGAAELMSGDRPDLYRTPQEAWNDVARYLDKLRLVDGNTWISFASYVLVKAVDDGVVEWTLTRKMVSLSEFPEDNESYALAHVSGTSLTGVDEDVYV